MIEALFHLVIVLIVAGVILWAVTQIISVIPMDATIKNMLNVVVRVVAVLIVVLAVIQLVVVLLHLPPVFSYY